MTLTINAHDERRRSKRADVALKLDVLLTKWDQVERCYTKDLSQGGLRFVSGAHVAMHTPLRVVLHLPDDRRIDVPAVVRHVRTEGEAWSVGVEFVDTPGMSASVLDAVLGNLERSSGS